MSTTQLLVFAILCVLGGAVHADQPRPIIGAIRWDAWHVGGDNCPARAMERSLGPEQYHYRVPFFGRIVSNSEVRIDGYTQEIVDQEIAYAKAGGIDYWAFLLYDPDTPMSQALSLYLSSAHKNDVRFCAIATPRALGTAARFDTKMKRLIDLMAQPTYQKVAGGRPLLYLFSASDDLAKVWSGRADARPPFDGFREAVKARGLKNPYMVVMDFHPDHGKKVLDAIGADAISTYAIGGGAKGRTPYSKLTANAEWFWNACAATGAHIVPTVMAGWDRRPRIEHPVPWEDYQKPGVGIRDYYVTPTPKELAAHIEHAMRWAQAQPEKCPAQAVLIYAWNEHDEGGWLCPTLGSDGKPDTLRLDAINSMLRAYKAK